MTVEEHTSAEDVEGKIVQKLHSPIGIIFTKTIEPVWINGYAHSKIYQRGVSIRDY